MRISGGKWRGRKLRPLKELTIRPTADRAKSALFNILCNSPMYTKWRVLNSVVLDAFAGTGALGLECLSRGAASALFIDNDPESITLLDDNIKLLGAQTTTKVLHKDATKPGPPLIKPNLIFLDPPYNTNLAESALSALLSGGWIPLHTLVIVETSGKTILRIPYSLQKIDFRKYGNTGFWFLTKANSQS
tara:strand:+ start:106 stop:675 length:570 start_codon:yes stop_codon:yes gene_type:complete